MYKFVMSGDTRMLPSHLGGHQNETHTDRGSLHYFYNQLNARSLLDVGCGPGEQVLLARQEGFDAVGIDGDFIVQRPIDDVIIHDYVTGPYNFNRVFDIAWCVEFVEHVDEQYLPNFVDSFQQCKQVFFTHALPGQPGHHHVNCRYSDYWIDVMDHFGFVYEPRITREVRAASTMVQIYARERGLFFTNKKTL